MRPRLLALSLALCAAPAHSDEGMWMPSQLPEIAAQLRAAGFKGEPGDLAELAKPPMNAVVKVGGATGAFVSGDGLVLTNHHVAFGVIQYNSKPDKDLIKHGYIAADRAAELPANPDYRVLVTTGFDRITDRILAGARGKQGRAYYDAVDAATKAVVAECEREPGNRCSVANMYYGTDFYLIRQLELRDIRLVYAPPDSIGNYGDEVDNFVWPRHSGDFTLLRAYVGRDGKPADYSPDNVPYQPPGHLQVSTDPVREGDYAMLAGYPGITFRHRMASEFKQQIEWQLPSRVALFGDMIKTVETAAAGDAEAKVRYAAQVASFKNTLKRAQGELDGLRRSDAVRVRADDEAAMLAWLAKQREAKAIRADIDAAQRVLDAAAKTGQRDQLLTAIRSQSQLLRAAITLQRLAAERAKPDAQRESGYQQRDETLIAGQLKQVQRRYAPEVEKRLLRELLIQYKALPQDQRIAEFDAVFPGADADALQAALDSLYAGTRLGDEAERLRLMNAPAAELKASDDSLLKAATALMPALLRLEEQSKAREGELLRLRPAYMRALIGFRKSQGRAVYPDANSTLRVSYGKVSAMDPRDGVRYRPLTTVQGIVEKHTGVAPFDAPQTLREAIAKGDFGSTVDPELKTQTVDFLTNLDTTGGNSGSPVLDAHGKLIGLNFDSNWEAVSASWMFDPRYKRAIHVDLRYMRWLLAKVYPAPHLLKEMNLPAE
ncbi:MULTISPECIES: S46 family peptidase [unclassified Lysobacter]|uniref:S46 family peptidase n=1 Tax=unclassified Lysobacter TaxID=2635362 RepID=UPI0006F1E69B|nr:MULTISPECIES: S46 family peptidase [unclassified Lysobacter]KQZ66253.1 peptidase S46 [Lysobacter sp. Root559]KRC30955.1 peptidase S46 [Lysobacter sp. Root76]KRD67743.1 peptidase S46 [Lysobacter sp. Root96]